MDFIALDVETANPDLASICQIGVARFESGQVTSEFSTLVDPQDYFDFVNVSIHGIDEDAVGGAPTFAEIAPKINAWLDGAICATHTHFDRSAIHQACSKHGALIPNCDWLDTARVARRTWQEVAQKGYGLGNLASKLGIEFKHHDALEDAKAAGKILCLAIQESGLDLAAWQGRVKQPTYGSYIEAVRQAGNPNGPLFKETLVFTGAQSMRRRDAAKAAAELGCAVVTGVSKKISMLVVGDQDVAKLAGHDLSSKHRTAPELIKKGHNIRIIRETDFNALLELA